MKWLLATTVLILFSCAVVQEVVVSEGHIVGWKNNGFNLSNDKWDLSFDSNNSLDLSTEEVTLGVARSTEFYNLHRSEFLIVFSINKVGGTSIIFERPILHLKESIFKAKHLKIGKLNKFGECNEGNDYYNFKDFVSINETIVSNLKNQTCVFVNFDISPPDPREEFSLQIPYMENSVSQSFEITFKPKVQTFVYK